MASNPWDNISPTYISLKPKIGHHKRTLVFQSSIFRCYVSFREGILYFSENQDFPIPFATFPKTAPWWGHHSSDAIIASASGTMPSKARARRAWNRWVEPLDVEKFPQNSQNSAYNTLLEPHKNPTKRYKGKSSSTHKCRGKKDLLVPYRGYI